MPRDKKGARRQPQRNPVGVLHVASGGYGFVETPEGEYFVPERKLGGAFDGDTVEVRPVSVNRDRPQPGKEHNSVGRKPTARVVNVVVRAHEALVGRYEVAGPFGVVVPSDARIRHDIFTMHADNPHVRDGDLVRVRIVQYPGKGTAATGVVEEVVGHAGERGADIDALVAAHNLRTAFPDDVLREAASADVDAGRALEHGYRDLRGRCTFTIDPPDARDFDDALSLEAVGDGLLLGVHIADVSWYVRPGSALDAEARMRSTSVYLVDRVLPMLPEALSAGVCSLVPGEDRLCMTVDICLDDAADVTGVEFYPALTRSSARLDYGQVQRLFDAVDAMGADAADGPASGGADAPGLPAGGVGLPSEVASRLLALRKLARALKARRRRAGALDLETPEVHMLLDDAGVPVEAGVRRTTEATELVEQCMVLANELVARRLNGCGASAVFRVHDVPDASSLSMLVPPLQELGYARLVDLELLAAGSPRAIQRALELSRGREEAELVSTLLLRSMKRACYSPSCSPHFGLALDEYLHFTSPIRRYPDLVAHRALKRVLGLAGTGADSGTEAAARLALVAEHASAMERASDEAARQSQEMKLVEYLSRHIGETFPGVVSRVSSRGFLVRLDNTATGLVPLGRAGSEPFRLDVRRQTLTGQDTGRVIRLGQRVRVHLVDARPSSRQLDFELASS